MTGKIHLPVGARRCPRRESSASPRHHALPLAGFAHSPPKSSASVERQCPCSARLRHPKGFFVRKTEVSLVDQRGGLQSVIRTLLAKIGASKATQFDIDNRQNRLQRLVVPPFLQWRSSSLTSLEGVGRRLRPPGMVTTGGAMPRQKPAKVQLLRLNRLKNTRFGGYGGVLRSVCKKPFC
jgi:hypothetical protein